VTYVSDATQYGLKEYWAVSYETLERKKGDCDDGAILLYDILRNSGIPAWKLRVNAGYGVNPGTGKQVGHAYVTYYSIENDLLIIHRKAGNIVIPFSEIKHSTTLSDQEMKGTIRTFGVGGFFGYWGSFSVPSIGSTKLYATQMRNYVLIVLQNDKNIIITPDDVSLVGKIR
jgi:hypothetical protein